ncbi:MAG: retention module-containing protein [Methylophaga sp.]
MATSIGVVKNIIGTVTAVSEDGSIRQLQVGDKVFQFDVIATSAAGAVEIELADGSLMDMGRNAQMYLDAEVFEDMANVTAPTIEAGLDDVEALQQALLDGADPTTIGEATAAGAGADLVGNEGSSSAVVRAYLNPVATPENGFDTTGPSVALTNPEDLNLIISEDEILPVVGTSPDSEPEVPEIPSIPQDPQDPQDPDDPTMPEPLPIIVSATAHTVGNSNQGTLATATALKSNPHNSAEVNTFDDGFYAVDHQGNDNPEGIDFREAILFEFSQPTTAFTFEVMGATNGGNYILYDADGKPLWNEPKSMDGFSGTVTVSDETAFSYISFLGGSTGPGNSGAETDFAIKPIGLQLTGTDGNDVILGTQGNDLLIGGLGDDILTGGDGADQFVWQFGDNGVDTVTDFDTEENDVLDVSDLLAGAPDVAENLDLYLKASFDADNDQTIIEVFTSGDAQEPDAMANQTIVVNGDIGSLDSLVSSGNLTVDNV